MHLYLHWYVCLGFGIHPSQSSTNASIMHLLKGYHAETFLKHSGKKNVLSKGEVESLLSLRDKLVVEGELRLLPIPGHNNIVLCNKPLKPMSEARSSCATLSQFPPLLCHASPHETVTQWIVAILWCRVERTLCLFSVREISIIKAASCL